MRHTLLKLTGLLLVLMLVLTGCNLIGVDAMKQLDVDFAKLEKDYAVSVADYDGGRVTKADVLGNFMSTYSYYAQMYNAFGMQIDNDTIESIKQQTLETAVQSVAIDKELQTRGLSLSEDKLAEVQSSADDTYAQAYDSFYASAEGKDEAVRARQTEYNLYTNGYSRDVFYKAQLDQANYELIQEIVRDEIGELTEEELTEAYNEKVAEDEEQYADDAGAFESAMASDSEIVAWIPEGYRVVKHILVKPEDDVLQAVTDARTALSDAQKKLEDLESELDALNDDDAEAETEEVAEAEGEETEAPRTAEEIETDIADARAAVETAQTEADAAVAACLESVKGKTDEIYEKIEAGEDFAALIAEYGEDPGMQNEPTATRGYYVSANSENWDANFTAGAMALAGVGSVSETPVVSTSGVHIIRYESDAAAGAVALEEIRDALYEETLESAKDDHFTESLTSWTEALHPVYHLDAFTVG